ncbi:MAG: NUDIX hydrolase [Candidatus Doudnabacteria bacterium]|nr:NUDIX hydrolase [Candidatus Doudnabacteria bacterium]MCA9387822.1 NUDIX hydrolase [Candidatus Andersenbacteria bacterium]
MAKRDLVFRPAAYGIVQNAADEVLILTVAKSGKFVFPGGGIDKGELAHQAVVREIQEESGIEVKVDKLYHVIENFFSFHKYKKPLQAISLCFTCTPTSQENIVPTLQEDNTCVDPRWAALDSLDETAFTELHAEMLRAYKACLRGQPPDVPGLVAPRPEQF